MQLGNIGLVYRDKGDSEKAYEYYQRSLKQATQIKTQANAMGNIAAYWGLKRKCDESLKYYQQALEIFNRIEDQLSIKITQQAIDSVKLIKVRGLCL
jgi:tetratricopeptide (TPR) repeat protein